MRRLIKWVEDRNYEVVFKCGVESCFHDEEKRIYIDLKLSEKNQLYTLLHEIGHLIIFEGKDKRYIKQKNMEKDKRRIRSYVYKVLLLREEIEAWELGRGLAKELNIWFDEEEYDQRMTKCIKTYCEFVIDPEQWEA